MRTIYLDFSRPCGGQLASKSNSKVIGCAMGEVLFQAGVPVDVLIECGTSHTVHKHYPNHWRRVVEFLGIEDIFKESMLGYDHGNDGVIFQIEDAYDSINETNNDVVAKSDIWKHLVALGRQINIDFQIGTQGIAHSPMNPPQSAIFDEQPNERGDDRFLAAIDEYIDETEVMAAMLDTGGAVRGTPKEQQ